MLVVSLIKKDVFAVVVVGEVLQDTLLVDSVLECEPFPELVTNLVAALAAVYGNNLLWHYIIYNKSSLIFTKGLFKQADIAVL